MYTGPSAAFGSTPDGHPTFIRAQEDGQTRRSLELENSAANTLADQGYRVRQNPTKAEIAEARLNTGDVGKTEKDPDYLVEGRVFDCYSPTNPGKSVRSIWTAVATKVESGQTQRVVVNLEDWHGDLAALKSQFAEWPVPGLKEVKAITRDGEIVQVELPSYRPMGD